LKQFLRYQISGTVFLLWFIVFYYGGRAEDINELVAYIHKDLENINSIIGVFAALPIGVIIHQLSVLLKNLIGVCIKSFSDFPNIDDIKNLDNKRIKVDYILERISNLNSFYYVRFDNGILSPLLAWWVVSCFMNINIHSFWLKSAFLIGFFTAIYIPIIWCELKYYKAALKKI